MSKTLKRLNILGYYQLIGGIIGIVITLIFLINQGILNGPLIVLLLTAIILMTYSTYCGFLLIRKQLNKGIKLSIINQALQIIGFGVLGYSFKYASGVLLGLRIDLTNDFIIGLDLNITTWKLNWNSDPELTFISINFIAILILGFIFRAKEKLEKQNLMGNDTYEKSTTHNNV